MKIILADDQQLFREGLRALLELVPQYQIASEVDNTEALLESVSEYSPELVIQDYRMPTGGAISTLNKIKIKSPKTKLIILTGIKSEDLFKQLINSTADGVLLKEVSGEYLLQAIAQVLKGKRVLSPTVQACSKLTKPMPTAREFQVLEFIIEGFNNSEIAEKLGLTTKTVKNHRYSLMQKLEVRNVTELMKHAYDHGLLTS